MSFEQPPYKMHKTDESYNSSYQKQTVAKFLFPVSFVSKYIIGKGGESITRFKKQHSNVLVFISKNHEALQQLPDYRIVVIASHDQNSLFGAIEEVLSIFINVFIPEGLSGGDQIAEAHHYQLIIYMLIPSEIANMMIGRGGSEIKKINTTHSVNCTYDAKFGVLNSGTEYAEKLWTIRPVSIQLVNILGAVKALTLRQAECFSAHSVTKWFDPGLFIFVDYSMSFNTPPDMPQQQQFNLPQQQQTNTGGTTIIANGNPMPTPSFGIPNNSPTATDPNALMGLQQQQPLIERIANDCNCVQLLRRSDLSISIQLSYSIVYLDWLLGANNSILNSLTKATATTITVGKKDNKMIITIQGKSVGYVHYAHLLVEQQMNFAKIMLEMPPPELHRIQREAYEKQKTASST